MTFSAPCRLLLCLKPHNRIAAGAEDSSVAISISTDESRRRMFRSKNRPPRKAESPGEGEVAVLTRTATPLRITSNGSVPAGEIQGLAQQLIRNFGVRSTAYANHQALKAREAGDKLRSAVWRWIAGATLEILRSEPGEASGD